MDHSHRLLVPASRCGWAVCVFLASWLPRPASPPSAPRPTFWLSGLPPCGVYGPCSPMRCSALLWMCCEPKCAASKSAWSLFPACRLFLTRSEWMLGWPTMYLFAPPGRVGSQHPAKSALDRPADPFCHNSIRECRVLIPRTDGRANVVSATVYATPACTTHTWLGRAGKVGEGAGPTTPRVCCRGAGLKGRGSTGGGSMEKSQVRG